MTNEQKLQSAIKRKMVLRDTLGGTSGYKVNSCKVTRLDKHWYGFDIDGYYFECKWDSSPKLKDNNPVFWFRNNEQLKRAGFCYEYGVPVSRVKYASSLHFGSSCDLIPILWVVGEILETKPSYDFYK